MSGNPPALDLSALAVQPFRPAWQSPVLHWNECDAARRKLLYDAWSIGQLDHLLTPSQFATNQKMNAWSLRKSRKGRFYVLDSSRRWGKSVLLLKRAFELAIRNRGWRIVYFAPVYKDLLKIVLPLVATLTQDCPPGLLGPKQGPEWLKSEGIYYFPNSSRVELIGLDVNPDGARGQAIDYAFGDEVAFFANLEYLLTSVVMPQMLGRQHARIECASTPPVSPSHYWTQKLVNDAALDGAHDVKTIEDANQYSSAEIEEFIAQAGGREHTTCLREYFCKHITDDSLAIIPEYRQAKLTCVREVKAPTWRYCFVSMDPGFRDNTAVLFAYWDFDNQRCVIEDEICGTRLNSEQIATLIKRKEQFLWGNVMRRGPGGTLRAQPYLRITDHDPRLTQDLAMTHNLVFVPTLKDQLQAQVNKVRVAMGNGQIVIHPRCKLLQLHLENGVWKNPNTDKFAWGRGDFGHFDCVAALLYLWRAMEQNARANPYPPEAQYINDQEHNPNVGQRSADTSRWQYSRGQFRVR